MKKKLSLFIAFIFMIAFAFKMSIVYAASDPIDEIEEYYISIDMLLDGSANITYHFKWKVLNDSIEGPVENIYIGIPNKNVSNIKSLSENISSIEYTNNYNGSSGNYVKVEFYRSYYENEIIEFDFSIEQSHLYILDNDNNTAEFAFTPGWFPNVEIKDLIIKWNGNYSIESNCDYIDDNNQLVWQTSLPSGKDSKFSTSVTYDQSRFETLDSNKQRNDNEIDDSIIMVILIIFIAVVIFCVFLDGDGYSGGGGSHIFISSGGGGCACASSCACACACAGGGRAGCSVKDFYVSIDDVTLKNAFKEVKKSI